MRASNLIWSLASMKYVSSLDVDLSYFIGAACHGDYAGADYYKSGLDQGCYDVEPSAGSVVVSSNSGHVLVDGWKEECNEGGLVTSQDLEHDCITLTQLFNGPIKKLSIGPTQIGKRDEPVLAADRMDMLVTYTGGLDNIAAGQWTIDELGNMLVGLGDGVVMEVDPSEHDSRGNFDHMEDYQKAMSGDDHEEQSRNTPEMLARNTEIYGVCTTALQCSSTFLKNQGDNIRKGYKAVLKKIPDTGPLSAFKSRAFYGGVGVATLPYIVARIGGSGSKDACGSEKGWQQYLMDLSNVRDNGRV